MTRPADQEEPPGRPLLRVVRGDATPDEIAALAAVLLAGRAAQGEAPRPRRSVKNSWSDRSRQLRRPLYPAPGAWRGSALPG
jgi:Acyl-CoA carboxylase epsilon subunit